jgi:hypothetical protein
MQNTPLAPVDFAQAAINFDEPSIAKGMPSEPNTQSPQTFEAGLSGFEPGFVLTRDQPAEQIRDGISL